MTLADVLAKFWAHFFPTMRSNYIQIHLKQNVVNDISSFELQVKITNNKSDYTETIPRYESIGALYTTLFFSTWDTQGL